jgi:HlyD family secretion protein
VNTPVNVQNVITYDVVIGVSNLDLKLFPGMTANVKILVDQRPNVLKVLNAALRYHPATATPPPVAAVKGGRKGATVEQAVWNLDANNKQQRVVVTTGESDGTYTEVTSGGLKDGDRVIIAAPAKAATAAGGSPVFAERQQGRQRAGILRKQHGSGNRNQGSGEGLQGGGGAGARVEGHLVRD